MKLITSKFLIFAIFITLIFFSKVSHGQKDFKKLTSTTDSTFGYTADNPLKLKRGNQEKSIDNSHKFLSGLKTLDDQTLTFLFRLSIRDPAYKKPLIGINDRQTGLPISGKLGMLDKYVFLTSNSKDTIVLFIDIYNKGDLFLPVGLKYDQQYGLE